MATGLKEKLTKILIDKNLIKEADLQKTLALQKEKGGSLSDLLVTLGFISKNDLMTVMSENLGIPTINLSRCKLDPAVLKLIPKKMAKHYRIMPISKTGDMLTIAVADPFNIFAIDEMKTLTGFKISTSVTTEKDIDEAISQYYDEDTYATIDKIVTDMKGNETGLTILENPGMMGEEDSTKIAQEAPVVKNEYACG